MLAELREYARSSWSIPDSCEVEVVIDYFEALNKLFEKSFLGQCVRVFRKYNSEDG